MNIEELREFCLNKKGVTEGFPFDNNVLVFKVLGKMFLLTGINSWDSAEAAINLKCDPEYALQLRAEYNSVEPGYHMSKKHWNTLQLHKNEINTKLLIELINHSYDLVLKSLPKKMQDTLK